MTGTDHTRTAERHLSAASYLTRPDGPPVNPEVSAHHLAAAQVHATLELAAAVRSLAAPALPTVVYRAWCDSIPLGTYTTPAAARAHCEACVRREAPGAALDWIEDEADGVSELVVGGGEDEWSTGYVVTAVTVAAEYDAEADE